MDKEKYNWVLVYKKDQSYIGWSKSNSMPRCGDPELLEWIEWNKTLPEETEQELFYSDGNLIDSAGNVIPLPEVESESAE